MDPARQPLFPQFALLPAELRLRIWSFAAPRRTIPVRLKQDLDAWNWASNLDWWMHYNVVPDGQSPSPIPAGLLVNTEARRELIKDYRHPLKVDRDYVRRASRWSTDQDQEESDQQRQHANKNFEKMCDASSVRPFNVDCDVLEWAETWRWHRDAMMNITPLFVGACLSVQHISVEYALWMHGHLDVLAKAVISKKHPSLLRTITVTISQPRERRQTQYRLARRLQLAAQLSRRNDATMCSDEVELEEIEASMIEDGAYLFDPTLLEGPDQARPHGQDGSCLVPEVGHFAVYQVFRSAELKDGVAAQARLKQLRHESGYAFNKSRLLENIFDSGEDDTISASLGRDVVEWCLRLNMQAVDPFSKDLPEEFTIPCHGVCTPEYGLPGTAAERWVSTCLRRTDWDKVWARRGVPAASPL